VSWRTILIGLLVALVALTVLSYLLFMYGGGGPTST